VVTMGTMRQVEDQLYVGEDGTDQIKVEEAVWGHGAQQDPVSACSGRAALTVSGSMRKFGGAASRRVPSSALSWKVAQTGWL
jgi:hypothetical protein